MAGVSVTQQQFDNEIAGRIRNLSRIRFELNKMKETADRLGDDGMLSLDPGGRSSRWTADDVREIRGSLNTLVAFFDSVTDDQKISLDSMAGFGF